MQETRVLVETRGTTDEETISYWFDLPIDVAEFEEKLGVGAESGDYRIIEKVLPLSCFHFWGRWLMRRGLWTIP